MNAPVRWGILGAARFAREHMAPAIAATPGGRLAALASRSGESNARAFRDLAPDLTMHASYQALIEDRSIDAVYIPLPNHLHMDWTLKALAAGKHVLCEKPMAMHADQFEALIEARDRAGRLAAEAFMIVHHPQWDHVRKLLADGAIGALEHVEGLFSFRNTDPDNIRNQAETGGGALRDIGVYILGATRLVTASEPDTIDARVRLEHGVDVFTDIRATFPGFTYSGTVSMRMAPMQRMTFCGRDGVLTVESPFNTALFGDTRVVVRSADGETRVRRFNDARQYEIQVRRFNDSVRTGCPFPCPLEFSRGTQQAIDRVLANATPID
ncbi:MAG: Gfo/Idh/MocA family oxidoreductase [Wenzhouxiangellaceae bacterium]|nr:Gfo/Idh/MocA family oxidoreductase [Wenzhouxiangellaceae bacterium]